jgi:hypothetical protein
MAQRLAIVVSPGAMTEQNLELLAVRFVDQLVPGRFHDAAQMLDPACEYLFGGQTLRGEAIIAAFQKSDEEAHRKFDAVEYLPGRVAEAHGARVVVQVFDRLVLGGRTHTYSDRLAITLDAERSRPVVRIEHLPFAEERAALAAFLQGPT